jgi:hypothetical protein
MPLLGPPLGPKHPSDCTLLGPQTKHQTINLHQDVDAHVLAVTGLHSHLAQAPVVLYIGTNMRRKTAAPFGGTLRIAKPWQHWEPHEKQQLAPRSKTLVMGTPMQVAIVKQCVQSGCPPLVQARRNSVGRVRVLVQHVAANSVQGAIPRSPILLLMASGRDESSLFTVQGLLQRHAFCTR